MAASAFTTTPVARRECAILAMDRVRNVLCATSEGHSRRIDLQLRKLEFSKPHLDTACVEALQQTLANPGVLAGLSADKSNVKRCIVAAGAVIYED